MRYYETGTKMSGDAEIDFVGLSQELEAQELEVHAFFFSFDGFCFWSSFASVIVWHVCLA